MGNKIDILTPSPTPPLKGGAFLNSPFVRGVGVCNPSPLRVYSSSTTRRAEEKARVRVFYRLHDDTSSVFTDIHFK
jgi:hypothetical protein